MVTYTTTYNLKKPTVGQDDDQWGAYANDTYDLIDDLLDGTTPVTGIDINSGTLDNVTINSSAIGGTTAAAGTFTTLSATTSLGVTGNITVSGTVDGVDIATRDAVLTSTTTTANAALPKAGGTMTGAITFATGQTFDGRDVSADGSKLDGIESGATADQTKADIDALGINAATLDSLDSTQFLRSDASDTFSGATLTLNGTTAKFLEYSGSAASPYLQLSTSGTANGYFQATSAGNAYLWNSRNNTGLSINSNFQWYNGSSYETIWRSGNDGSGSGLDADLLDGYHLSTTRNSANTVPVRDSNGYLQLGWINTTSGSTTSTINKIYASYDDYVRYVTPATLISQLGLHVNSYSNDMVANSAYADNWFRSAGATGWYNQSYGGGIYMQDSTWVRVYASKQFLVDNKARADSWQELYTAKSGTSVTIDADTSGAFSLSMSGNTTFTFSGVDSGISVGFVLQLTGNGSTVTWPSSVDWAGGTAPDAPASGETDIYVFWTRDGGTTWYGVQSIDAAA